MYNIHLAKDHSPVHSINFALLDQFCVDYLYHEGLTKDNATVRGSQYDPFKRELEVLMPTLFLIITRFHFPRQQIRQQILDGCISAATALITEIRPDFLKTRPRLAFRLCMQEFIELLRASPDNQAKALAFLQDRLVPLAHKGSSDADAELRKAMLYLVYGPRRPTGGAEDGAERRAGEENEWSLTYLATLATHVHQRLLQYLGVHEPRLTLAARYLCIIHNMHHFIRGEELSVPEAEGLLMPDTEDEDEVAEAAAEEEEVTESEERSVAIREEDVNKLAQVTLQPHTQARCALILAHGSLPSAFMASLSRMRISRPLVASLVTEYCAYRGLVVGNYIGESQLVSQDEVVAPAAEAGGDLLPILIIDVLSIRLSTPSHPNRKIRDLTTPPHPLTSGPSTPNDRPLSTQILDELHELGFDRPYVRMYAAHRDGREMEFEVEEGDDDATPVSPQLYFALKRCEFLERIRAGEWERAVEGVREGMAPLTVHDPALVQPLKDTVMLLAYRDAPSVPRGLARRFLKGCGIDECVEGGDAERMAGTEWWGKARVEDEAEAEAKKDKQTGGIKEVVEEIWSKFNYYTLAGPLYAALGTYLGLPEPALVRVMAGLLEVHTKYYEMQQDEDRATGTLSVPHRFAPILSIDLLKRPDPYLQPPSAKTKVKDEAKDEEALQEAEAMQSGLGLSREEVEKKEEAARRNHLVENDIATVQDVMACTRYEAIDMLLQHGGTLNGLLGELFG
ncbi:hypothetical protein BC936DRAFT_144049 [Jimgerdemannia flammicorona]|uniref:CTLH domain-containing protein n=1 Tax=Jimgerdemannia flammicorona TaxID=994334 RepID=A0A433DD55_9FUNG|nr:hypothetical protein BC936DRAFT_144049 [Jimgerdemannia flammicorona]